MQGILDNLKSLGWKRLTVLGGAGVAMVFAMFFGLSAVTTPDYVALYRDLSPAEAGRMVESLEQAGIRSRTDMAGHRGQRSGRRHGPGPDAAGRRRPSE